MRYFILFCLLVVGYGVAAGQEQAADLVLHNGAIYTMNPEQPWIDAIAVADGIIIATGTDAEVMAYAGSDTEIIDLEGLMVMPGFQDPHLHVLEAGMNESGCFLDAEAAYAEYLQLLQNCAFEQDSEWLTAAGVSMAHLLLQERLPIDVLDEAYPDRPVMILDNLGHGVWVNSRAMQIIGYDNLTVDPPGSIIVRDPVTNEQTGILLENAQQAVRSAAFPPTEQNLNRAYDGLLIGLEVLAENGITTVSDAGGYWTRGHDIVWAWAEEAGDLTVRASNALYLFPDIPYDEQIEELRTRYTNNPDALVRFNQVKIYVDGILSQGTGALLQPYENGAEIPGVPDDGYLYFDIDTLNRYAADLDAIGFQLHFHVAGDRGTQFALDAIEQAQQTNLSADARHRLTHLFLVDAADRARFSQLNVFADFQMAPSSVEDANIDYMYGFIGARAETLLPMFEILETGAPVVISSDWDADELSPFVKIQTLIEIDVDNVLSLDQILRMMTLDVARLLFHEQQTGSLEVGKFADMIVLNQNLFEISPDTIAQTEVLLTFLAGEIVYER